MLPVNRRRTQGGYAQHDAMGFKCCSSYTIPAYLWTVFSSISAVLCSIGLYFSNWLERETPESTYNSVSSFRLCLNETKQLSTTCEAYFSFDEIYSPEWKAITLLMGMGSCSLIFAGAMSLFGLCIRKLYNRYVTVLVAAVQCLGGKFVPSNMAVYITSSNLCSTILM